MNYRVLLFALCLGILVGVTLFSGAEKLSITGAAAQCYVDNELCSCSEENCVCGERIVAAEYCNNSLRQASE